jgi:hypothetical protein
MILTALFEQLDKETQYKLLRKPECAPLARFFYRNLWIPSTETEEVSYSRPSKLELAEKSDLRKLGYHTNISNYERRKILTEKAVPHLGLQTVINKLSGFIYYRKRQKGGAKKYERAISIWESDIEFLKKTYQILNSLYFIGGVNENTKIFSKPTFN